MKKIILKIEGMSCDGCKRSVKHLITEVKGVSSVNVSLEKSNAEVSYDERDTSPDAMISAVNGSGIYKASLA